MITRDSFDDAVGGERLGGASHPVHHAAAGRVCRQPGCTTVLSIYNDSDRCAAHDFVHVGAGAERRTVKHERQRQPVSAA